MLKKAFLTRLRQGFGAASPPSEKGGEAGAGWEKKTGILYRETCEIFEKGKGEEPAFRIHRLRSLGSGIPQFPPLAGRFRRRRAMAGQVGEAVKPGALPCCSAAILFILLILSNQEFGRTRFA
jgi:hypothetical protein